MMDDFEFYCPTKIFYRTDSILCVGKIVRDYGFKRVYIVSGKSGVKLNILSDVEKSFIDNKIEFKDHIGIDYNPDISSVLEMKKECLDFKPEMILAIGGGSIIDASKLLAHLYFYTGNPLDFNKNVVKPIHALKIATILTLSASGSEMSSSCVISDRKTGFKGGFNSETNYPLFSIINPKYTYSVSKIQTSYGLVDMFSHSFERFYSSSSEIEPCDSLSLAIMKNIVNVSDRVLKKSDDYQARRAMMLLGSLSHNGIGEFGKRKRFVVHKAEHYLSGKYPSLAHGQGIALLLDKFLILNRENKEIYKKTLLLGKECFSLNDCSFDDVVPSLLSWLDSLDIKRDFSSLPEKIKKEDIEKAYQMLKI